MGQNRGECDKRQRSFKNDLIVSLSQDLAIARMTDKAGARRLYQEIEPQLCASRADALAKARDLFGPALDVFMYRHVAPGLTSSMDHIESAEILRAREQGCR